MPEGVQRVEGTDKAHENGKAMDRYVRRQMLGALNGEHVDAAHARWLRCNHEVGCIEPFAPA